MSGTAAKLNDRSQALDGLPVSIEEVTVEGLVLELARDLLGIPASYTVVRLAGVVALEQVVSLRRRPVPWGACSPRAYGART